MGKPVAKMVPIEMEEDPIFGFYKGKIKITGDIVAPMYTDEEVEQMLEASMKVSNIDSAGHSCCGVAGGDAGRALGRGVCGGSAGAGEGWVGDL